VRRGSATVLIIVRGCDDVPVYTYVLLALFRASGMMVRARLRLVELLIHKDWKNVQIFSNQSCNHSQLAELHTRSVLRAWTSTSHGIYFCGATSIFESKFNILCSTTILMIGNVGSTLVRIQRTERCISPDAISAADHCVSCCEGNE
jgi:hypothetical protein